MIENPSPPVLCFGEILWDSLPQGMFPGGAPMNVAYHLNQLGERAAPVTAVGSDVLGDELLRRLRGWELTTEFVAVLTDKATGLVRVEVSATGSPSYDILQDAAWDWIRVSEPLLQMAEESAGLVFGSLAQRSEHNRAELQKLRRRCKRALQIFDVNLRPPFVDPELVWRLARGAHLIKLNDQEIEYLLGRRCGAGGLEAAARDFSARTGCSQICVTAGSDGAGLLKDDRWFWEKGRAVTVKDTVGAGDAFLAGLVKGLLEKKSGGEQETLGRACRLAEFVASSEGATPAHSQRLKAEGI